MQHPSTARTSAPAPTPVALKSRLGSVMKGKAQRPPRILIYGPEGVGKSSLALDAGAIFLNIEDGLGELDAARYPFRPGEVRGDVAESLADVYAAIDDLATAEHGYGAVAIDTIDALEQRLLWPHVCAAHG